MTDGCYLGNLHPENQKSQLVMSHRSARPVDHYATAAAGDEKALAGFEQEDRLLPS